MELKTTNIKGTPYIQVSERIRAFRTLDCFKNWRLITKIIEKDAEHVFMQALVEDNEGIVRATGTAEEWRNSSFINKTSYVENCETSAWGRALGNLGIGVDTSVATAEEVLNAMDGQEKELFGKPKKTDKTQSELIEDMLKQYPALMTRLAGNRNIDTLTNVDYGNMMQNVNQYRNGMAQLTKVCEYYAKVRGISSEQAKAEIEAAYQRKLDETTLASVDEIKHIYNEIKEMADSYKKERGNG